MLCLHIFFSLQLLLSQTTSVHETEPVPQDLGKELLQFSLYFFPSLSSSVGKFFLVSNLNPAHCGLGTILLRTELSLSYWVMISLLSGGFSNPYLLKTLLRSLLWKTRNLEYPFRKKISRAMSCKENPFYCSAVSWNGEPTPPPPHQGNRAMAVGHLGLCVRCEKISI